MSPTRTRSLYGSALLGRTPGRTSTSGRSTQGSSRIIRHSAHILETARSFVRETRVRPRTSSCCPRSPSTISQPRASTDSSYTTCSSQTQSLIGTFGAVKLNPWGPVTLTVQPGKTYSIPFALTAGYALSYVFGVTIPPAFSALPATMAPEFTFPVLPGGRVPMWANITVPAGTADGTYVNYFVVGGAGNELPQIPIRVNLIVGSTRPAGAILAPAPKPDLPGPIPLQA